MAGASVAVASGAVLSNEVKKVINGIVTENGIFYPLYENHSYGISEQSIPGNIDIYFRELANDLSDYSPADTLFTESSLYNVRAFPDSILERLSQANTEVMVGDLNVDNTLAVANFSLTGAETSLSAGIISYKVLKKFLAQSKEETVEDPNKRKFLKYATLASVVFGLSNLIPSVVLPFQMQPNKEVRNLASRLNTVTAYLHPEHTVLNLRSLVMADKMLEMAKDFKLRTNKRVKMAFQVGSAHSNIEDFLEAGQDFCRSLIFKYPDFILKNYLEVNSGAENFATSRIYSLPTGLSTTDLDFHQKIATGTIERRVVDYNLANALSKIT